MNTASTGWYVWEQTAGTMNFNLTQVQQVRAAQVNSISRAEL